MRRATLAGLAAATASILLLSGCASSTDGLADAYGEVAEQDYFSSDGAFSFIAGRRNNTWLSLYSVPYSWVLQHC